MLARGTRIEAISTSDDTRVTAVAFGYPIFLELAGRHIVVIGAGAVREGKVEGLLAAGATDVLVLRIGPAGDRKRAPGEVAERLVMRTAEPARTLLREQARRYNRHAGELRQHHWPFVGFDEVAIRYTKARTWQDCAQALDPSLPEVQPKLSE